MRKVLLTTLLSTVLVAGSASALGMLKVTIDGATGGHFPKESVRCVADGHGKYAPTGHNASLGVSWSAGPAGTKSYAIIMTDPDVPSDMSNLNKDGATVAASAPRQQIYHWVLVDIPADRTHLSPGDGNVFAEVFGTPRGDAHGEGLLFYEGGYGGPCPPWNDMKPHHYRIRVYALDVPTLGLTGPATGSHVELLMKGHLLAQGDASAAYATNAAVGDNY